jgi:hypothetical protein
VRDALVLVDVVQTFEHEDGERLLESFGARHEGFVRALERARGDGVPGIYANDTFGVWDGDASSSADLWTVRHTLVSVPDTGHCARVRGAKPICGELVTLTARV